MDRPRGLLRHPFVLVPPAFYLYTLCPSIGFGDTAIMVDAMRRGLVDSQVNTHALTVLAGMLLQSLPVGELAWRAHLVSWLFGSATVVWFYFLVLSGHPSRLAAAVAAAFLMTGHSMWWHSTLVESYAASALLTTACLWLWHRFRETGRERFLYWLCFTAGLGPLNHVQLGFLCAGVAVTGVHYAATRGRDGARVIATCALAALSGLAPWLWLLLRDWAASASLGRTLRNAFVGSFAGTFFGGDLGPSVYDTAYLFWFQSPTPYGLCGVAGLWMALRRHAWRDPVTNGTLVFFTLNTATFAFYPTWDKFAFLLVSFVVFHHYAAQGLGRLFDRTAGAPRPRAALLTAAALCLCVAPLLYGRIATWALDPRSVWAWRYHNRYSENLYFQSEYVVNPNKRGFREVERFATRLFERLPASAIYLDDDSRTYYCIADYYQRHYGRRPDVSTLLVNSWGIAGWGLGAGTLSDLMARAHFLDKPFFVASLQSPYDPFIRRARERAPIEFERFPLGENRWIYRLITARETSAAGGGPDALERIGAFSPLRVAGASGFWDLSLRHLLFFSLGQPTMQDMHAFPGSWVGNDQVFVGADKPGAVIELGVRVDEPTTLVLTARLTAAPDFGIVEVEVGLDGPRQRVDLYGAHVQPTPVALPPTRLEPGLTRIRLTVTDRNPRSSGYRFGIDGLYYRLTSRPPTT